MTSLHEELYAIDDDDAYHPYKPAGFAPVRIILAKGSKTSEARRRFAERICATYPEAEIVEDTETPHNRIRLGSSDPLDLHEEGKRTLVLAEHRSAVRHSTEEGNACPNYWHFSPYGFCPYGCSYCYLAGTQGVRFSPTVKIFLNLAEILDEVDAVARRLAEPTAFYLGKLQDGLALDSLTGYSRRMIPFFAAHPIARMTLLTKNADVTNLLDLEHGGHTVLSWTLNPLEIIDRFETNTPKLEDRIAAMEAAAQAGYPIRAVVMPIIPISGWESIYGAFVASLLHRVRPQRITLGSICSYPQAMRLMERKIGRDNEISARVDRRGRISDGRIRFPEGIREKVYRYLVHAIRRLDRDVEVSLCLEDPSMFRSLDLEEGLGRCNCVL